MCVLRVRVCVHVCVCMCVRVCMCVKVHSSESEALMCVDYLLMLFFNFLLLRNYKHRRDELCLHSTTNYVRLNLTQQVWKFY